MLGVWKLIFSRTPYFNNCLRIAKLRPFQNSHKQQIKPPLSEKFCACGVTRLEGDINLEPEYRDAYCNNNTSSQQDPLRKRSRERSLSGTRHRADTHWLDNDNGDCFGAINAADDQDAFQILHTRVHNDSLVGKPPTGNRR